MRAEFAANLALQRQKAGLSQRQAAQDLQVSQALLSHYEKGIREPGLDFVVRAADYYGVSADELLGTRLHERMPVPPPGITMPPPNRFAAEIQQELRDTLDILMDMFNRNYDDDVFCYAGIYLAESLYELMRHFCRITEGYEGGGFFLEEESFLSGAVTSDMAWVRAQYIKALRLYQERVGELPAYPRALLQNRYKDAFGSAARVLRLVGERVSRQDVAESQISDAMFDGRRDPRELKKSPKEEEQV